MLTNVKERLGRDDEGFTLIELMVVVLIIAILLAIAIPTFLGARGQANSRAAQSSLRNALTAEQTYYTNNQQFANDSGTDSAGITVPKISTIEPNLSWTSTAPTGESPNTILVTLAKAASTDDSVYVQAYAKDGNCYTVLQSNNAPSGKVGTLYEVSSGACVAPSTVTIGGASYPTYATGKATVGGGFGTSW